MKNSNSNLALSHTKRLGDYELLKAFAITQDFVPTIYASIILYELFIHVQCSQS